MKKRDQPVYDALAKLGVGDDPLENYEDRIYVQHMPNGTLAPPSSFVCERCGAVVANKKDHNRYHRDVTLRVNAEFLILQLVWKKMGEIGEVFEDLIHEVEEAMKEG